MQTNSTPDLSIVIPVLNEAAKIRHDIGSAAEFCHEQGIRAEIVVSDDGSTDGTVEVARQSLEALPEGVSLVVLAGGDHHGKGHAVRRGLLAAKGAVVMFADSGGNVSWRFILEAVEPITSGVCQIVHGSRKLPGSNILTQQPLSRRILSSTFQGLTRLMLPIPGGLTDTQCGFKFYSRDVAQLLYQESTVQGFLFDLEIILRAQSEGFPIREIPIDWRCDRDSRLRLQSNFFRMGKELKFLYQRYGGSGKTG